MLDAMGIGELADAAGLTRRAIRFYVQQRLLDPPIGLGRGTHYQQSHLDRLKRIMDLQQAGYSLDQIRQIVHGNVDESQIRPVTARRPIARTGLDAELWSRLTLLDGVELHFDSTRHAPDAAKLLAIRDAVRAAFMNEVSEPSQSSEPDTHEQGDRDE